MSSPRTDAFREKSDRLAAGAKPRVLDLFSGCGGLSLGFQAAGFEILAAVEHDRHAADSHALNFSESRSSAHRRSKAEAIDIEEIGPDDLSRLLELGGSAGVDVVIGGPPCQAFSRVGRAKLRALADSEHAHIEDPRARLHESFLDYVSFFRPLAVLMENVPDSISHGRLNIPEEVCRQLDELGFESAYTLLNAASYGVPQYRQRVFLIAYNRRLRAHIKFPPPSSFAEIPSGYRAQHRTARAFSRAQPRLFGVSPHFAEPPAARADLPPATTVEDALSDLPPITEHLEGEAPRRRPDDPVPYRQDRDPAPFAAVMRGWPGFETKGEVTDHVTRHLPRDYPIFERMKPGDTYEDALTIACSLFEMQRREREEQLGRPLTHEELKDLRARTIPPYDRGKFRDKWRKLDPARPSHTIPAHLSKDCYSHIHPDPMQARTITIREAARLQSFPDGFRFSGGMNARFRQIGNAVPPLLARALAEAIRRQLPGGR